MRKKRILLSNETSLLNTGFSGYGFEFLSRLHETGKYELAELATYGDNTDRRIASLPWRYFPVKPDPNDKEGERIYNAKVTNQWGEWRFDDVCLEFRPDIVVDIRDWWMLEHEQRSFSRPYFHWVIMPTVDSMPQEESWIYTYLNADGVFCYSDWAVDSLLSQSNGKINILGSAPPGANLRHFQVIDKQEAKGKFGLNQDILLVGTVMRNQHRKLYPDLMEAFRGFIERAPESVAKRTFLYIHAAHPDIGWDMASLLKEHGLGSKTYFTYFCKECQKTYPNFFQDNPTYCKFCGNRTAILPDTKIGIPPWVMSELMAAFDVYVQYSICMPAGEKVLVNDEWKNIEDVRVGDIAFTHKGRWMPVTQTFVNECHGDVYTIKVYGDWESSKFTTDHPVYGLFKNNINVIKNQSLRETIGHKIRNNQKLPEPIFIEAGSVQVGDLIGFTIDDSVQDYDEQDDITIDNEFCKFIGLFAADGSWDKKGDLKITSNIDETENHSIASNIFNRFGSCYERKYINRKAVDKIHYSKNKAIIFKKWFCKHECKQLPKWTSNLPLNKQLAIIQGLMMGDGSYVKDINTTIYVTISEQLADQLKHMLRRCRINFNARLVNKTGDRKPQYRFEITGNGKVGNFEQNTRKSTSNIYINNIHYMKVKSIDKELFTGKVYNFEVQEDNSFCCKIGNCHNCEGFGMPQVEAAASGTPVMAVDYSAMSDIVRKVGGYPIKVKRMFRELQTGAYRAYPDNDDFVDKLIAFLRQPKEIRVRKGFLARKGVEDHYTWEKTIAKWEKYFDEVEIDVDRWSKPAKIHVPKQTVPGGLTHTEFTNWALENVAGMPELCGSFVAIKLSKFLKDGFIIEDMPELIKGSDNSGASYNRYNSFTRDTLHKICLNICASRNLYEQRRTQNE